jgi:hypothetical protein
MSERMRIDNSGNLLVGTTSVLEGERVAIVAALATNVDAILTDTGTTLDARIPAALVGGRMDASVGAMAANVITASALASDAVSEIQSGAIADIKLATDRFLTMIVLDGVAWQFTANALELGAGGSGSSIDVVLPAYGTIQDRVEGTKITVFYNEAVSVAIGVTDASGNAVTLTGRTLILTVEDGMRTDLLTIPNGSISKSGSTATVTITTAVSSRIGSHRWALRDASGDVVLAHGVLEVAYAAEAD